MRPIAMNVAIAISAIVLLLGSTLIGNESKEDSRYDYNLTGEGVDFHFKVLRDPVFPTSLRSRGVTIGRVTIQLEINYDGELHDWLVTHASHKGFAEAVEKVVGQWKFAPPIWKGKPISIIAPIKISFKSSGDVVTFDITSGYVDLLMNRAGMKSFDAIEVVAFDDLDAYPEPIKIVRPIVPKELLDNHGYNLGVFRFYIDTEGRVRLPHVDRVEGKVDVRLLEAAQDALEQWRFEPPTSKGRKVIVEVAQPFTFNASDS